MEIRQNKQEIRVPRGSVTSIPVTVIDTDGNPVDLTAYDTVVCTVWRPEDRVAALILTHNDALAGGAGVYLYGDTYAWDELELAAVNQLVAYFDSVDTTSLKEEVYQYDIRISLAGLYGRTTRLTVSSGSIQVQASGVV